MKLEKVLTYQKGRSPQKDFVSDNLILYLTPEYLRGNGSPNFISDFPSKVSVEDGDLLLLWDGSNAGEFFKGRKGFLSSTMVKFRFNEEEYQREFLFYQLKAFEAYLKAQTNGSGIPHVDRELLLGIEVEKFGKPEQNRIAQILSKADAAIAQTEALIAKYQRIKTGLMQDLLTKGIDENGNIRSEQTHRFKIEKGLRVPEEWEVVELESVCHKIADRDHTTPVYVSDGVFIVSPKDFNELHEIDFSKCQMITLEAHLINRRKTNIEVDDLIFTRIGAGLGKICKVTPEMPEFSILHSACMLKPNQEKILSDFLMYYIKSEFAQKQIVDGIQSIGVPDLGMDKIRTFLVKKPKTLDEQVKVLKPLLKLDNLIRKETAELSKQKSLKTGLMQDLLSGKVRVNIKAETLVNP